MDVSVIGTGYLGATHAAVMAELGHRVVGFDVDETKIDGLRAGNVPFFEPDLPELLAKHVDSGALRFTTDMRELATADVHFVCVGTPQKEHEFTADLSYLDAAVAGIAALVKSGAVVVGKSTVPVGTARRLAAVVERAGADLVWNPEFLREGLAVDDSLRPERIVLAGPAAAVRTVEQVYRPIIDGGTPVVVTNYATAELVKVAANSFLATKLSFINAVAEVCEASGADVSDLSTALGYDHRISRAYLRAGLGFGGGCLPKDVRAFMACARELGLEDMQSLLSKVDAINLRRRERALALARQLCGGRLAGRRAAVLGLAFKPDSDDIRDSPALAVALGMQRAGTQVRVFDPEAMARAKDLHPELSYAADAVDACRDADVVMLLTEWDEFRRLTPEHLAAVVAQRNLVDARNLFDLSRWRTAGWTTRALGIPQNYADDHRSERR
jgi:UDPglucose 6-dehydrogenase